VVAVDAVDERSAETVDGERPSDLQRFAGAEVGLDLFAAGSAEADEGGRDSGAL
jgi:hypothetical protein